jgi:hypothetical protein
MGKKGQKLKFDGKGKKVATNKKYGHECAVG